MKNDAYANIYQMSGNNYITSYVPIEWVKSWIEKSCAIFQFSQLMKNWLKKVDQFVRILADGEKRQLTVMWLLRRGSNIRY